MANDKPSVPATPDRASRRRRRWIVALTVTGGLLVILVAPVWGSMFGEENTTLVQMLVQLLGIQREMSDLNKVAGQTADFAQGIYRTYQQVNAGINEIKNYTLEAFVNDVQTDLYRQYPGFAKLDHASRNLASWNDTFSSSPWTAYQAISAVAGDVSAPLRADVAAGRRNIDRELILKGEAAGGFAAAYTAEQVTKRYDQQIAQLQLMAQNASPGQAAQLTARANLMMVAQQSYVMRLLARAVRLHSVDASLEYGSRMDALNYGYEHRDATFSVTNQALSPPALIDFSSDGAQPLDPYAGNDDSSGLLDPYASPTSSRKPLDPYPSTATSSSPGPLDPYAGAK